MKEPDNKHIFDDPRNVRRIIYALYVVCTISLIADFFIHRHIDHPWEVLFGFYAIYGFVACVLLVQLAKVMRNLLMRGEDYYDD